MGFGIHFRACSLQGSTGIHFICADIKGAQYKCFLELLFLQPWGLHEDWLFFLNYYYFYFFNSEASLKYNFRQGVRWWCLGYQHFTQLPQPDQGTCVPAAPHHDMPIATAWGCSLSSTVPLQPLC